MSRHFNGDYIFVGAILHSKTLTDLEILPHGYIAIQSGKILSIGLEKDLEDFKTKSNFTCTETKLSSTQFIIPGLIDCHIHAPQFPNLGLGLDRPLLDWLVTYTFPLEAEYSDVEFATKVYKAVVKRTLACGTTTASYFATIHKESSLALAKIVTDLGQRALVGKVNMNAIDPHYYTESTDNSIQSTLEFIEKVLDLNNDLVQPVITPRFALSCCMDLMTKLGNIAKSKNLHIQSHIAENLGEVECVKSSYPTSQNYADVYDNAKLLTGKCVMAHAVHLDDDELKIFKQRGTSIAHCPSSNTNLNSGMCNVRRLLRAGLTVGLGTDVSGGASPQILDAMRRALDVSTHISFIEKDSTKKGAFTETPLDYKNVFYLATLGGATALSMEEKIGNFQPGKEFDALLVDLAGKNSPIDVFELTNVLNSKLEKDPVQKVTDMFQKFIYLGDDRNIINVFVKGRVVKDITEK